MFDPFLSYSDRMKVEGIADVKLSVDESTQKMIATNKQLASQGVEVVGEQIEAVRENTEAVERMSQDMTYEIRELSADITDRLDETNTILSWGFANISSSLGRMEGTLKSLLESVNDTERAWAYAQYQKCLENYRKGLHKEAIERIQYAIEGHGETHLGEKEDYRFHYLLGSLYLGRNITKPDESLLDAEKAEKAFLAAAYYAEADFKAETAKAYVNAGISALLQSENDRALEHVEKALMFDSSLAEGYFQKGKILCRLGKEKEAFAGPLKKAIEFHPMYAEKAAVDVDVKKHKKELEEVIGKQAALLQKESQEKQKKLSDSFKETDELTSKLKVIKVSDDVIAAKDNLASGVQKADEEATTGTLLGLWMATKDYEDLFNSYKDVVSLYLDHVLHDGSLKKLKETHDENVDSEMEKVRSSRSSFLLLSTTSVATVLMLIQIFVLLSTYDYGLWTKLFVFTPVVLIIVSYVFHFADDLFETLGPTMFMSFLVGIMLLGYPEFGWMTILAAPLLFAALAGVGIVVGFIAGLALRTIFMPKSSRLFAQKKEVGEKDIQADKELLLKYKEMFSA